MSDSKIAAHREELMQAFAGKTIKNVTFLDKADCIEWGWPESPILFTLDDDSLLCIQCDPEGNGPGAIWYSHEKGNTTFGPMPLEWL